MLAHACYLTDARIRREAEALAERGFDIHVISLGEERNGVPEPRQAILKGVHIHRLPIRKKRGNFLRYVFEYSMVGLLGGIKLAALQLQGRIKIVHVHNMPDILTLAGLFPRLCGSVLILDVHDPSPELYMSWGYSRRSLVVKLLQLQERISFWLADRVVSVNETMRENLRSKHVPDGKISIVHNFPDQSYFPVCKSVPSWPPQSKELVMLYCGTVTEHYDLGLAIKAMARLAGEVPVKLKVMGDGNKLDELLELATKLGVRDSVEVVRKVQIDKVAEEMRKAHIGISCHREGIFGDLYFSTKIVEYLTQGLCVVSTRTRTIEKYLSEDCLFYFNSGSDAALADTIRYVWLNPKEVMRRGNNARQHLARLSWQAEKDKFLAFYDGLLNGSVLEAEGVAAGELSGGSKTKLNP